MHPLIRAKKQPQKPATLGDVLYAKAGPLVPEQDWVALVQSISTGDQLALHALYERAHRIVFTLLVRLAGNRETAEELTLDLFHDIWHRASSYDAANSTVIAWIMNQARLRAIERLGLECHKECSNGGRDLRFALAGLTPKERLAIEITFFGGLTYAEAAESLDQSPASIKTHIRSGLHKLRDALSAEAGKK